MAQKQKQHHCPVCKAIAKPRCFLKNHLVHCRTHDVYHSDYSECAQCKADRERAAAKVRNLSKEIRADKKRTPKWVKGKKKRLVESSIDESDSIAPNAVGRVLSAGERRDGDIQMERLQKGDRRSETEG